MRSSACDTTANSGKQPVGLNRQQIVLRQLNIKPTLTIRPVSPVRVIVTREFVLMPYVQGGTP